jgi:hypothetical protein
MLAQVLVWRLAPVVAALTLSVATLATAVPTRSQSPALLPDLEQELPTALEVATVRSEGRPVFRLGFRSAVRNMGHGPLLVTGRRASTRHTEMTADQVIEHDAGPRSVELGVGRLRYVISADHRHWHLIGFERYELRRLDGTSAAKDRKTGFCLGDRYRVPGRALPGVPPRALITGRCGLGAPGLLDVREGISVGYGDDYDPHLEGQFVKLSGLPSGRYMLVHMVNATNRLRELRYDNNASSLLIRLRWRDGRPRVGVLRACPGRTTCADR